MENLFVAATCSQCGGPVDASKLHCSNCSTDYVIDWRKTVVAAVPQSTRWRDQAVDAVLIAALQREAIAQNVEVALVLKGGNNESHLTILVKDKKYGRWDEVGWITGFATSGAHDFEYHIGGGGEAWRYERSAFWLEWHGEFGKSGRFYCLRDDGHRHYDDHPENLRGEQELFNSASIRLLMRNIVSQAYKWVRFEQEQATQAAAEEQRRQKSWIHRIFG